VNRVELINCLSRAGYFTGAWNLDDDEYSPVSVAFIDLAHEEWLKSLPPELLTHRDVGGGKTVPASRWIIEAYDCDNIARDFGCFLSRCMAVDAVKRAIGYGNIAAGKFNFMPKPGFGHAINWFMDYDGCIHNFDAGSGQLDYLTHAQLATISAGEST